ncbi:MAG: LPS assembly lipoprotein LptE [Legionella sp.]|nr:LPS assembly lipoprotein LptE [Legionella sp.]
MKRGRLALLFLTFMLTACGFHLRGIVDIPKWLNNVAIISKDGDRQFGTVIGSHLISHQISVNPEPSLADYWLIINKINVQQQIISIGASTNPRQYQIIMTVEFLLQSRKGQIIKAPSQVVVIRQLTVNNDRILGSNQEEAILMAEMRRDAVIQIINRLSRP